MDFDGEPSGFLENDVDMSRFLSLCRAVSPRWHGLWSFDDGVSLMGVRHMCEPKTPPGTNVTEWQDHQGMHDAELVRSYTSTKPTALLSEYTAIVRQEEPTVEKDDSYTVAFTSGEESTEAEIGVVVRNVSPPLFFSSSYQRCKEDRLLNLIDFVPAAQTDHSVTLSAIKSYGGRRDSVDNASLDREFRQDNDDAQSSSTQASQLQSSAVLQQQQQQQRDTGQERRKLFGLPHRINVSKREINMMSPLSF